MGDLSYADLIKATGDNLGNFNIPCPSCGPSHEARHTHKRPVMRVWRSKPDFVTYTVSDAARKALPNRTRPPSPTPPRRRLEEGGPGGGEAGS